MPAEAEQSTDRAILRLLLSEHALWSDDEIARELGNPLDVSDSLARLYGAGLVHRFAGFAFATRPAVRGVRLATE